MGTYLTEDQITRAQAELALIYTLPYASNLVGTAWEQILADIKGGIRVPIRDNRPRPDFTANEDGQTVNYSVKAEGLRLTKARSHAHAFLGHHEDFIVARPKVDELFEPGDAIDSLGADELGTKVLTYYNEMIVKHYQWHVISFLLRLNEREFIYNEREFIYWEERPPTLYDPADYWWRDSGRATGDNRNINGYPHNVSRHTTPLPRAKYKFTSGGKQFYVLYKIPLDADVWTIAVDRTLTTQELRDALRQWLYAQKRTEGHDLAT